MSTQYAGLQNNITGTLQYFNTITSATNASPIVVTVSNPHLLTTGDRVEVANETVNTAANGIWTVTVLSSTTFALNGSTGNGAGGATGSWRPLGWSPDNFSIPSDGDATTALSVNVALTALGDRTAWLKN